MDPYGVSLLMRAVVCLPAVLFLAAATSAVAQEKHLIDPMVSGSLNPKPLPPLKNPDAPSTPAKELFARKSTPFPGPPRPIGGDFDGCLVGAVSLPITGTTWQVMRPSHSAPFSASSRLFGLKNEAPRFKRKKISATIAADVKRFCHQIKTEKVFGTHSLAAG